MEKLYVEVDNVKLHFATESDLITEDEKWLVTLGGVFSNLAGDYVNAIATGRSNKDIREVLRRNWYINDRASFEQNAQRLTLGDKRNLYTARFDTIKKFYDFIENSNVLIKFLAKFSFRFATDWYQTRTKADFRKISKELDFDRYNKPGVKKSDKLYQMLKDAGNWIKDIEKIGDYHTINSMIGWDAVCLVNLVRYATQVHYIEREEFVKYAGLIKNQVQAVYKDWNEVILAYVIGSLLWNYSEDRAKMIIRTTHQYLTDERSPIHSVSFK